MTKLQQIKEIIIKSNPEIVELKFGCEVTMGNKQIFFIVGRMPNGDPITVKKEGAYDPTKQGADVEKIDGKIQAIGRHIRLADVLLAVNDRYSFDGGGWVLYKQEGKSWLGKGKKMFWNLKDDNLDNQSEECIDFIYSILT